MKIQGLHSFEEGKKITFNGQRIFRNTVAQLTKNNAYSLSEPNQRYISNAITELGKIKGSKNINFLLDTAAKSTYSTNIVLKDAPKNDWRAALLAAVATAVAMTPFVSKKIKEKIANLSKPQELKDIEKEILNQREQLLAAVDLEQIKKEGSSSAKDFERNLDYFIVSSETTLEHKKYVLERLNYFMSDEYEINPQLEGKKSIAISEMVNDMAIHTPGNDIPNIKAVDQRQHGICGPISIVRKKVCYEDKPNYVDSILSELDSSSYIEVYDRTKLGTKAKTKVQKVPVDFEAALGKGYRIIDASAGHWMQIGRMGGASSLAFREYTPFDKQNFDVKEDSVFNAKFDDAELEKTQGYYQALVKAKEVLEDYKASYIKKTVRNNQARLSKQDNVESSGQILNSIKSKLHSLDTTMTSSEVQELTSNILKLQKSSSSKIEKENKYQFIRNEENFIKKDKMKNFILANSKISEISKEDLNAIYDLAEYYHEISDSNKIIKDRITSIRQAKRLYEVGAAFRYSAVEGLKDTKTLNNLMINNGIDNKEDLVIDIIETLIEKLESDDKHSQLIVEQLAPALVESGLEEISVEMTIAWLEALNTTLQNALSTELDDIYASLTLGSRQEAFVRNLIKVYELVDTNADKGVIENISTILKTANNKDAVLLGLQDAMAKIMESEEGYIEVFEQFGNTSQIQFAANMFQKVLDGIAKEGSEELIVAFLQANNMSMDDDGNAFSQRLLEIQNKINYINALFSKYAGMLKITDENGEVLYSPDARDAIIKKMENKGQIPSAKALRELQTHLDKITKDQSTDEFNVRKGKLRDKSLEQFSKQEIQTLKNIDASINAMYSYVQKELTNVRRDLGSNLEELNRYIGVNTGRYWVRPISGGVQDNMEVRILEYMTGRPHHVSQDFKSGIEKIKTSPYSAITNSFVSHNSTGSHAQYVADIAPVKLEKINEDGTVTQVDDEILFHDNTWGAYEKENIWKDSSGLTRTDYKNGRGGTLGYVTNEKYRNGNLVSRILNEMVTKVEPDYVESKAYRKIRHTDITDGFEAPSYDALILDGKSPNARNFADQIHDALFISNAHYMEDLKTIAEKLSEDELKAKITSIKNSGQTWKATYEELKRRIFPVFGEEKLTEEEYNSLPDDDYLKVVMEKIALKKSYPTLGLESQIAAVRNVKELGKFRAAQKNMALNSFKYSFGKDHMILKFLADEFGIVEEYDLNEIYEKYNLNLTEDQACEIAGHWGMDLDYFNGSVRDTIKYAMEGLSEDIDKHVDNPEARKEIKDYLIKYMEKKLYFQKSDINHKQLQHIVKFIDRVFDPVDDNELVKAYRAIQNMPMDVFKKEIMPFVKPEDLNIKPLTGYEVLKRIQNYDEKMNTSLVNTVYYDNLVTEIKDADYKREYSHKRLFRKGKLIPTHNFESLYRDLRYSLSYLDFEKMFNKYKGRNLNKYGVYPAYPKLEMLGEDQIKIGYDSMIDVIENNVAMVKNTVPSQIANYKLNHRLLKYVDKLSPKDIPTDSQYKNIHSIIDKLVDLNWEYPLIPEVMTLAESLQEIPKNAPWSEYLPAVKKITKKLTELENTTPVDVLEKTVETSKAKIDMNIKAYADSYVQEQYRNSTISILNDIKQATIKGDTEKAEMLKEKLYNDLYKIHILRDTHQLLQRYVKSCAKDSELHYIHETLDVFMRRSLIYATLTEMQDIIMDMVQSGNATDIKSVFNDVTIKSIDGEVIPMGSEQMVATMVHKLLIDNNVESPLMLIEKLGLGEIYVEYMAPNIDTDAMKEIMKEAYDMANDFKKFQDIINPRLNEAGELLEQGAEIKPLFNKLKKDIKKYGKENNVAREDLNILINELDEILHNVESNPKASASLLYVSLMQGAKQSIARAVQAKIDEKNKMLKSNATLVDMINQVIIDKNSKAQKARIDLGKRISELAEYKKTLTNLPEEETSDTI